MSSVGGLLQRHRVLEEDAALGAEPGADHDRRRGRQAERVGAGDDDDGDGEQQRLLDVAADDEVPDDEGQAAADERDEHQPERGPVGEPLAGRLGVLGLLDELDDLRERGVGADRGRAGAQRAVLVDRRADELVAGASSCTGRLSPVTVDSSTWLSPSSTSASTGTFEPGRMSSRSPTCDLGGRDLDGLAVAQHDRLRRGEVEQRADGVVGAAAGAHLEPVAEQHEGREHAGGLVEDLALDEERGRDRVQPAGADGDGDQHHHVQRPGAQRGDRAGEEDRRRVEDDRQAQQQLPDVAVDAERRRELGAEQLRADHRPQRRSGS